jgi:ribosomal protein L13
MQSTYSRSWFIVDATDKPLGRIASEIARVLRGKHKPTYTPHVDTGDFVVIVNADKVALTGDKATDKFYYAHSGYPGADAPPLGGRHAQAQARPSSSRRPSRACSRRTPRARDGEEAQGVRRGVAPPLGAAAEDPPRVLLSPERRHP